MCAECVSQVPLLDLKICRASIRDYSNHKDISWYIKMYYIICYLKPPCFCWVWHWAAILKMQRHLIFINNIYL